MLLVELHIPWYRFCGPGTNLQEKVARGERGIKELDKVYHEHDIAYIKHKNNENKPKADRVLAEKLRNV